MRDDDSVVGVVHRGIARAYPRWVIDYHHVINDRIGGDHIVVANCERCQSGSAFLADVDGPSKREPLFRAVGLLNAVLLMRDVRSGTVWNHYDGVGLTGRLRGARLPWIASYHMEWAAWRDLHPDTEVMLPPDDPANPDARHGHGREEFFSRPGIELALIPTITGPLDSAYPENEMVLGLATPDRCIAYPLREVQREGGAINDRDGTEPIVVFAGPQPDGFTMSAFVAAGADGGPSLSFERADGSFVDRETGSTWTIEGEAVDGPMRGRTLTPIPWSYVRWHAWFFVHRDSSLFRSERPWPTLSDSSEPRTRLALGEPAFRSLLCGLEQRGHEVRIVGPVVSQRRPRASASSVSVLVDGHPMTVHRFVNEAAARDHEMVKGAWSAWPLRSRLLETRVRRFGALVLESDPAERFADPAQIVPMPPLAITWAPVLAEGDLEGLVDGVGPAPAQPGVGFADLVRGFRSARYDVIDLGYLPPSQLRPGCTDGIALTMGGDHMLLFRFAHAPDAARYAMAEGHSVAAGSFVMRSIPVNMYAHPGYEVLYLGDDAIRWSPLLADARFLETFRRCAEL